MACGDQGPFMIFNPQFSALAAYSSIGIGDYHAMQWTVRKRLGGLLFDLNYTWSKSIDLGSTGEAGGILESDWSIVLGLYPEHLEPEPDARASRPTTRPTR